MKVKTPKNSPVAVLYAAAKEIVDGTRQVFASNGQDAREIRLPILMHGTDLRVTIEAGPKVAARNAIEHAQMEATGKPVEPTVDMSQTLDDAQRLLGMFMSDLLAAHRAADRGSERWHATMDEARRCQIAARALKEMERLI